MQLTITYTLELPDNKEEVYKLISLLRTADVHLCDVAQEQIKLAYDQSELLDKALEYPHPPHYRKRVAELYSNSMAWDRARHQAQRVVWAALMEVQKTLQEQEA